jgi:hypothetical protein
VLFKWMSLLAEALEWGGKEAEDKSFLDIHE